MKSIIYLLALCSFFASCKKVDEPTSTVSDVDSDCEHIANVKEYFNFGVGSWWVFQEENSGIYDTITVTWSAEDQTSYNFITKTYSSHQDYHFEYYPLPGTYNLNCPNNDIVCDRCLRVLRSKFDSTQVVGESSCFLFIPKVGDSMSNYLTNEPVNRLFVRSKQDNFTLGPLTFGRTICIGEEHTEIELSQPTNHYYSEGVGLIRKELITSNEIWNLIDYHIEE